MDGLSRLMPWVAKKDIAKKIVQKEADYLLAVKGNQKKLESAFDDFFRLEMLQNYDGDKYSTQEQGHARTETRLSLVNYDLFILGDIELGWLELTTMGIVASIRQEGDEAAESMSIRYYISSAKFNGERVTRIDTSALVN